jgi:hypothetical protein
VSGRFEWCGQLDSIATNTLHRVRRRHLGYPTGNARAACAGRTPSAIRFVPDTDTEIQSRNVITISFPPPDVDSPGTDVNGWIHLGLRCNAFASSN